MAIYEIFLFVLTIVVLVIALRRSCKLPEKKKKKSSSLPTNWPLVGMLPGLVRNSHRIHAYFSDILNETGGTFELRFPKLIDMDVLLTCDPANIHHTLSRNFSTYPRGDEFRKIFDVLGNGIFNADFELWEFHRRTTLALMTHREFYPLLERSVWEKVETGLLPVLDHYSKQGTDVDLADILQRFTFDNICKLVLDYDPRSLRVDLPYIPCQKAFIDISDAILHRHLVPETIWKLQKWLKIGTEKKLMESWKAFDEFIYPLIPRGEQKNEHEFKLLTSFRKACQEINSSPGSGDVDVFLRDTALSLIFAGRETTSATLTWLFWLMAANPLAEIKIREEIENVLQPKQDKEKQSILLFGVEESKKLVYLHGALCESLRLFPPVGMVRKAPIRPDYLPSGNHIQANAKLLLSLYSIGRMEAMWGKDCLEFKPERWISPGGGIKHEPSYKFPAFNAGPRTCLGKEMAFIQMKMVAATIIYGYNIRVVEGNSVSPSDSVILQAKNGLKVRLSKRNV